MVVQKGRVSNEMKLLRFRQRAKKGFRGQLALTLPAGKAKAGQSIATIFSQYGIDANKFCQDFNIRTREFISEVPTPITIDVTWEKTYTFNFRTVSITYVLGLLWYYDIFFLSKYISIINIFQMLIVNKLIGIHLYELMGTLRSMHIQLSLYSANKFLVDLESLYGKS